MYISFQVSSARRTSKSSKIIERSMSINVFLSFFFFAFPYSLLRVSCTHDMFLSTHNMQDNIFKFKSLFAQSRALEWRENWKNTFILHHNLSYLLFFLFIVLLAHSKVESRHGAARVRHRRLSKTSTTPQHEKGSRTRL